MKKIKDRERSYGLKKTERRRRIPGSNVEWRSRRRTTSGYWWLGFVCRATTIQMPRWGKPYTMVFEGFTWRCNWIPPPKNKSIPTYEIISFLVTHRQKCLQLKIRTGQWYVEDVFFVNHIRESSEPQMLQVWRLTKQLRWKYMSSLKTLKFQLSNSSFQKVGNSNLAYVLGHSI